MTEQEQILLLRIALTRTHSRLSLLRHRANIRWDTPAIGPASEVDEVLGVAERTLRETEPMNAAH